MLRGIFRAKLLAEYENGLRKAGMPEE